MNLMQLPEIDHEFTIPDKPVKREIVWQNVLLFIYLHMSAVYGLFLVLWHAKFATIVFLAALILVSTISVTLGCHRLWAHKAYDAAILLKLFYLTGHLLTSQGSVYDWVLDHRIHHKYHGQEADPYNYKKGFVHAHFSSKLFTQHPEIERIRRDMDMSDMDRESLVLWQKTLYWILWLTVSVALPTYFTTEYLNESIVVAIFAVGFLRIAISLHYAWLINSAFILWGLDPLDKKSIDTNLIWLVDKSAWPQYHYVVPWDYQVGEYGNYGDGFINAVLRIFASLGWAYDLRTVNADGVREAVYQSTKTGKSIARCLLQEEKNPLYHEMIANMDVFTRI